MPKFIFNPFRGLLDRVGEASDSLVIADNSITTNKINNNAVTNEKLADMPAKTIKGRYTNSLGDPENLTAAQAWEVIQDSSSLGTVGDVSLTSLTTGQYLKWNGTNWINTGIDVTDIQVSALAGSIIHVNPAGNALQFSGVQSWANQYLPLGALSDVDYSTPGQDGIALIWNISTSSWTAGYAAVQASTINNALNPSTIKTLYESNLNTNAFTDAHKFVVENAVAYTHPNHSGDVTSAGDGITTIAAGAVTLGKMANLAANTIIGNNTASPATPLALTAAQVRTLLNIADGANNYSHPNHTGDVTSTGDGATVIANNVVTNEKLTDISQNVIKGRASAGVGDVEDLTGTQVYTIIRPAAIRELSPTNSIDFTYDETRIGSPSSLVTSGSFTISTVNAKVGAVVYIWMQCATDPFASIISSLSNVGYTFAANTLMRVTLHYESNTIILIDALSFGVVTPTNILSTMKAYFNMTQNFVSSEIPNSGDGGAAFKLNSVGGTPLPTFSTNKYVFDGTQNLELDGGTYFGVGTSRTIAIVFKPTDLSQSETSILINGGGDNQIRLFTDGSINFASGANAETSSAGVLVENTSILIIARLTSTKTDVWRSTGSGLTKIIDTATDLTTTAVGANAAISLENLGNRFIGEMFAYAIEDSALSDSDITALANELSILTGITL